MAKTVYSLVLSDDIVRAVDAAAARQGLSRSALVAQVLAEYTSLPTPQQHTALLMQALQQAVQGTHLRAVAASGAGLTLRTALCCKYNPALSYTVDLGGRHAGLGRLRVSLRSRNTGVLEYLALFFDLWRAMETRYLEAPPPKAAHGMQPKHYTRALRHPKDMEHAVAGRAVADYVLMLDGCIQAFFRNLDDAVEAVGAAERHYLHTIAEKPVLKLL